MKFAVCLLLSCLSLISTLPTEDHQHHVQVWGNVHGHELGSHYVKMAMPDNKHTVYEFTYPFHGQSEYPIVGVKLLDYHQHTKVEFIKGQFGDHQLTLKVTADDHPIDAHFLFYVENH
ncbi:uncharacterized protein LOC129574489 [Sitodiplosis mosellana]|uniref:uncharacterized protein LOC129574489 n=1 Tax=Sitodiplosis mosellana TaxID=263140 RepID=UPI0024438112|nr:uncharacterized protein LOC129574489 [Sitodiplosis mosellana]